MVCFDGVIVGGLCLMGLIAGLFIWCFFYTGGFKPPHSYIDLIVPPPPNGKITVKKSRASLKSKYGEFK